MERPWKTMIDHVSENGIDHPIPTIYIYWGPFEYRKENDDQLVESGFSPLIFQTTCYNNYKIQMTKKTFARTHTH